MQYIEIAPTEKQKKDKLSTGTIPPRNINDEFEITSLVWKIVFFLAASVGTVAFVELYVIERKTTFAGVLALNKE